MADVPAELQRKFRLMRELDERTHQLEKHVDEDCMQQLRELAENQQGGPLLVLWWSRSQGRKPGACLAL